MPRFPTSTAEKGGGSTDDVSSSHESPAPVIAGVLVAVIVAIILLSLVVAAIICYKAKVVKKYNVESMAGAMVRRFCSLICFLCTLSCNM